MLNLCSNPVSSVPFILVRRSLVLRRPIFPLCERHRQRLRQSLVKWLFPLALGTHFCSPKLEGKPHLRFTCFSPGHVENAATPFSRLTQYVHMGAAAYIDEQSTSDEAVTRWRPIRNSQNGFFMFWSTAVVCHQLRTHEHVSRGIRRLIVQQFSVVVVLLTFARTFLVDIQFSEGDVGNSK